MSDLISRADAIDAITTDGTRMERLGLTRITIVEAKQKAVDLLESLPSADITDTEECQKCQETTERVLLNARKPNRGELKFTLPDGTEIPIDEESYEIGYTHGQMADRPTGKWVECESNHVEKIYLCSNCKNYEAWGENEKTPYCPNCGSFNGGDDK